MKRTYIKATKQIESETPKRGEPIEIKVARLLSQEEPIKDQVPLIYTERKTGINPEYNIRTDRFMIAMEAMGKISNYKTSEYLKSGNAGGEGKSSNEKEAKSRRISQVSGFRIFVFGTDCLCIIFNYF